MRWLPQQHRTAPNTKFPIDPLTETRTELTQAAKLSDEGGPPHDSAQYVSIRYTERLVDADIEPSVGSVGDSYANALAETVIGLFKIEVIRRHAPWRSHKAVEFATLE
jgi:putative transposase